MQDGFRHCLRALALHARLYLGYRELALQEEVQPAVGEEDHILHNPVHRERRASEVCPTNSSCPTPPGRPPIAPLPASSKPDWSSVSSPSTQPSQMLYSLLQELLQPLSPLLDELICAAHEEGGFPGQLWDRPAGTEQRFRVRSPQRQSKETQGALWQQQPGPCFVQSWIPGAQVFRVRVWGFYPHLF